jgi:hypothetical protein
MRAAQEPCLGEAEVGLLGLKAAAAEWRDDGAGVGEPTYRAAASSACGLRRGWRGDPSGGAAWPLRRGKQRRGKKLTSGPRLAEREKEREARE